MKKVLMLTIACMLTLGVPAISVSASSLDDVIGGNSSTTTTTDQSVDNSNTDSSGGSTSSSSSTTAQDDYNEGYIANIQDATNLSEESAGATKINQAVQKVASFLVQVLSYFVTAFLAVRCLLDICYITLPFTRSILANGYQGMAAQGPGGMAGGMGGMGMGGMGSGMGMGGMGMGGMHGGYGMNRGMGMGGMQGGMGGMQGGQPGATPSMGRVQWISGPALNAVAGESTPGPDGRMQSPLKIYAKDMMVTLIIAPVLLVLSVTGVVARLGFLIGTVIAHAIAGIGNMM